MIPSPFVLSTETRQKRSFTQDVIPFLNNLIFQYTNPLPFETEPHTIHTIPVAREHCDSYLYYIRYKTLEITPSQKPFQDIFNPVKVIGEKMHPICPVGRVATCLEVFWMMVAHMSGLLSVNTSIKLKFVQI